MFCLCYNQGEKYVLKIYPSIAYAFSIEIYSSKVFIHLIVYKSTLNILMSAGLL